MSLNFDRALGLNFDRLLGLNFDRLLDGIDFSTGGIFCRLCDRRARRDRLRSASGRKDCYKLESREALPHYSHRCTRRPPKWDNTRLPSSFLRVEAFSLWGGMRESACFLLDECTIWHSSTKHNILFPMKSKSD